MDIKGALNEKEVLGAGDSGGWGEGGDNEEDNEEDRRKLRCVEWMRTISGFRMTNTGGANGSNNSSNLRSPPP